MAERRIAHGAEKFVLVSTDKAVNPTNVMGATKRLAEAVLPGAAARRAARSSSSCASATCSARTGSVIPSFREQIARGGPVTVTHPEITRYFMSIPEAAQLVLQAGLMGKGGEIFVLDMGEPVKIVDLARAADPALRLRRGRHPHRRTPACAPARSCTRSCSPTTRHTLPTPHPKLRVAQANAHASSDLVAEVERWLDDPQSTESAAVRARLRGWIAEYAPSG